MIDVHSVEFYVLAFGVAMALVALLFGQRDRGAATTRIVALDLHETPDGDDTAPAMLTVAWENGTMHVSRTALSLAAGETVNLVATIIDDKVHIIEKRGVAGNGEPRPCTGEATVPLTAGRERWHVRYESEITGRWCLVALKARDGATARAELKY